MHKFRRDTKPLFKLSRACAEQLDPEVLKDESCSTIPICVVSTFVHLLLDKSHSRESICMYSLSILPPEKFENAVGYDKDECHHQEGKQDGCNIVVGNNI